MGTATVAICTHDRAPLLRGALRALSEMRPPERIDWELVVVLNHCRDGSEAVIEEFAGLLPVSSVAEARLGLSFARNRAIDVAEGDVLIWIDDDVRVGPGWLCAYQDAFARWPRASLFGGPIRPSLERPTPAWLRAALPVVASAFAERSLGEAQDPEIVLGGALPFGANLAVRTEAQRRHRFNPDLGRFGGGWIRSGEEIAVISSILSDGGEGRWVSAAGVDHVITPERQTLGYLRAYFEGVGRGLGRRRRAERAGSRAARLAQRWRLLAAELRLLTSYALFPPERWVRDLRAAAIARGRWMGMNDRLGGDSEPLDE